MPEFTVKFIGHLNERTRPEGFPEDVYIVGTYQVENNKQIAEVINNELGALIHQTRGMIVQLDPAQTLDMSKLNVQDRFYVPMAQLSYIRAEVKLMQSMPIPVGTGILDALGKEIKEYETPEGTKILPS